MDDYQDLKEAIRAQVLMREEDVTRIIASDELSHVSWLFDFRALLLQPRWLDRYAEIFWERHASRYPFQVCGMETAAISLVAAIVMKGVARGTPVNGLYLRKSRKRQGMLRQIEGTPTADPVILVDDLINSGGTFEKQIKVLADVPLPIGGIFTLIRFREQEAYAHLGAPVDSLLTLSDFGIPMEKAEKSPAAHDSFEVKWRFRSPNPSYNLAQQKSAPLLHDGKIYFGIDTGAFLCVDHADGRELWRFQTGRDIAERGIASSPAITDNLVYFGSYDGNVYALDRLTGEKRWVYENAEWVGSSPALAPKLGLLFIGLEFGLIRKQGCIAALDLKTGARVWSDRTPAYTHGSPLYIEEERLVVIGSNDSVVYAYQADTGELRWRYQTLGSVQASFAYDPKRRLVLFCSFDGNFYALSARDGTPIIGKETGATLYSTPCIQGDTVFYASLDKCIYALDMDTWKIRWTFATRGRIFASPVIAGGSLWCGSNDGKLYEIDPETGKLRNSFQASERIVNRIAYDEKTGDILMPTVANELYCLTRKHSV